MSIQVYKPSDVGIWERELERLVSSPIDLDLEAKRASRYRFEESGGRVHRVPRIGGGSGTTGTQIECVYANSSAGTAKNTFTTEAQINDAAGMGPIAQLNSPAIWQPGQNNSKSSLKLTARGIVSSTSTPTFQWFVRFGTSSSGPLVAGTAALTTLTTISNKLWELECDIQPVTLAAAGGNSTFRGVGILSSPAGLNVVTNEVWGGAAQPGTVATVDWSVTNSIWFAVACSASSASNGVTLLQLLVLST